MSQVISYKKCIMIALTITTLHICTCKSYSLKCPSQGSWKMRANAKCNNTLTYFCLYNNVERKYVEGCNGPDWDRKGSKRIFSGSFTRGQCIQNRFQPFKFRTNESMSDCFYAKSICSDEGQIVYSDKSTKYDRTCSCNHNKNFSFVTNTRNLCYCIPTEEDCSCKINPVNYTLSDADCLQKYYLENKKSIDENNYYVNVKAKNRDHTENNNFWFDVTNYTVKWRSSTEATALFCLCIIHIIGEIFLVFLFLKWFSDTPNLLNRWAKTKHTEFCVCDLYLKCLRDKLQELYTYDKRTKKDKHEDIEDTVTREIISVETVDEKALDTCTRLSVGREPNTVNLRSEGQCMCVDIHQRFEPFLVNGYYR